MKITIEHENQKVTFEDPEIIHSYEAIIACYQVLLGIGFSSDSIKEGIFSFNEEINPERVSTSND